MLDTLQSKKGNWVDAVFYPVDDQGYRIPGEKKIVYKSFKTLKEAQEWVSRRTDQECGFCCMNDQWGEFEFVHMDELKADVNWCEEHILYQDGQTNYLKRFDPPSLPAGYEIAEGNPIDQYWSIQRASI